eukprot:scaffold11144_cov111-Isochrysis_galbana.AAC.2
MPVRCVQVDVARLVDAHVEPGDVVSVVACAQRQLAAQLLAAVEMERGGLHPSVVGVARIVHVALVHDTTIGEELFDCGVEGLALGALADVSRLLLELATHRHAHILARVDHASGQRPDARVAPPNGHHLQHLRDGPWLPSRDDWVGRVHAPVADARAPAWVNRPAVRVEEQFALEGLAFLHLLAEGVGVGRVGPAFRIGCARCVGLHASACESARRVAGKAHAPVDHVVGHLEPLWVLWVLLAPSDRVHFARELERMLRRLELGSQLVVQCPLSLALWVLQRFGDRGRGGHGRSEESGMRRRGRGSHELHRHVAGARLGKGPAARAGRLSRRRQRGHGRGRGPGHTRRAGHVAEGGCAPRHGRRDAQRRGARRLTARYLLKRVQLEQRLLNLERLVEHL